MTDHDILAARWARINAQCAARRRLDATAIRHNKAALFDVLAGIGITALVVEFDGGGDSGQIENVTGFAGKDAAALPDLRVASESAACGSPVRTGEELPLTDAIEVLVFQCLTASEEGWENEAGAYGSFTFDVATRTIRHEHHARIEAVDTSHHSW